MITSYRILICLILLITNNISALLISDFRDSEGKFIEIPPPPFFDYDALALLDDYPSFYWFPYSLVEEKVYHRFFEALDVGSWVLRVPPPYYWSKQDLGNKSYPEAMRLWEKTFFTRYSRESRKHSDKLEYSEYRQKYAYLFYWISLCYDLEEAWHRKLIQEYELNIKRIEQEGYDTYRIQSWKNEIIRVLNNIQEHNKTKLNVFNILNDSFEEVTKLFSLIYKDHLLHELNSRVLYERGQIFFDQGDITSCLVDIDALITAGYSLPEEMLLQVGKAYNDTNQYNQAIKILSEAIQKNPKHKEAYFERAIAYFELGDFSKSLDDYLASSSRSTLISKQGLQYKHLKFSAGISTGILKGGLNSFCNFPPSLLSTFYGLSTTLWAFASNPIGHSVEFVEAAYEIIEYIKTNATAEIIATLIPELKECIQKWDNLDEQTKGYYIGHVIGQYGVDCLIWRGSLQTVKAFQRLKRANIALTLESACLSPHQAEEILASSKKFWQAREEFKAKCYLDIDQQKKHIRGAHNYDSSRSEITISLERVEAIVRKKLGEGIPIKGNHIMELNYKEVVNFGEEIGIVRSKTGAVLGPTTLGKIHYDKAGGYHVVPYLPLQE